MGRSVGRTTTLLAAVLAAVVTAGCKDAAEPLRATNLEVSGGGVSIAAGTAVDPAPTFVITDQNGRPMGNVPVTVAVTQGGGSIANRPTHSQGGATSIGSWVLGPAVGPNEVMVTVDGLAPARITVNGIAGPPAEILPLGSPGSGLAGTVLSPAARLRVQDAFGNGIAGIEVNLSVIGGGGSLGASKVTTDEQGTVTVPDWRLGNFARPQVVRAGVGAIFGNVTASVQTNFNIDVRFWGDPVSPERREHFTRAAQRITAVIVGALPAVDVPGADLTPCGISGVPPLTEIVQNIVIYASIRPIDGVGNIVGSAGPCYVRVGGLPLIGVMTFDSADIFSMEQQGTFGDVILHEMLHVLGFGVEHFWSPLLQNPGTPAVSYHGAQARQGCVNSGGAGVCATSVPVEDQGGAGTAGSHWRKSVFESELMTGFVSSGGMPFSRITIGGLADLGYVVNLHAHDAYSLPGASLRTFGKPVLTTGWETVETPVAAISPTGEIRPIASPHTPRDPGAPLLDRSTP
jgi:hypothetical protein